MANFKVASRYVKSLLGLAQEQGALDEVHKDMQLISSACDSNYDLVALMRSPIIKHDKKRAILTKIFQGKVNKLTMAIIDIVTRKNREALLPEIAREFHNAYNDYKGIQKATVTTTIALDESLRNEIRKIVLELCDKKHIELQEKVEQDLIGGFVLNVGDKQIDASISNKLKALKLSFSHNPYVKEF
ncbi:MAG TPA: ATP synthase F1 subunit delta [Cyclobacteriaceae bacterium]|nr:ATP synthase F1 subunit delta [Cyclobacteriaceae bacterium]